MAKQPPAKPKATTKPATEKKQGSIRKMIEAYKVTKQSDKHIGLILLGVFLGTAIIVGGLLSLVLFWGGALLTGVMSGLLAVMIVFGRRAERAAYAQLEGRTGAAAAALGVLRRGWQVQNAVAVTKSQDLVHRVVGRPGVILVGEGNESRVRHLLGVEKKRHARVVGEIPIHTIVAGDGENSVPIRKLARHIQKMSKSIHPSEITDLMQRLRALDAVRQQVPMPKGPIPTSLKQARQGLRGR